MLHDVARADADWLTLRESADAAARSVELVDALRPHLPTDGLVVHDLGCGTGSMARWLAPQLHAPQHWVGYERDEDLLSRSATTPPPRSVDCQLVTVERRLRDITRLPTEDLDGASLVTASALLDMMTSAEIDRVVATLASAACPVLITLSVIGQVELVPAHPLDGQFTAAFNAHQMRDTGHGPLTGPLAVNVASHALKQKGYTIHLAPSLWHLVSRDSALLNAWLEGWVGAACEQDPSLRPCATDYLGWRVEQIEVDKLTVTIHHHDLLALP